MLSVSISSNSPISSLILINLSFWMRWGNFIAPANNSLTARSSLGHQYLPRLFSNKGGVASTLISWGPHPTTCFSFICRSSPSLSKPPALRSPSAIAPSLCHARMLLLHLSTGCNLVAMPRWSRSRPAKDSTDDRTWTARMDWGQGWGRVNGGRGPKTEAMRWIGTGAMGVRTSIEDNAVREPEKKRETINKL